jgi:hypothetical protein
MYNLDNELRALVSAETDAGRRYGNDPALVEKVGHANLDGCLMLCRNRLIAFCRSKNLEATKKSITAFTRVLELRVVGPEHAPASIQTLRSVLRERYRVHQAEFQCWVPLIGTEGDKLRDRHITTGDERTILEGVVADYFRTRSHAEQVDIADNALFLLRKLDPDYWSPQCVVKWFLNRRAQFVDEASRGADERPPQRRLAWATQQFDGERRAMRGTIKNLRLQLAKARIREERLDDDRGALHAEIQRLRAQESLQRERAELRTEVEAARAEFDNIVGGAVAAGYISEEARQQLGVFQGEWNRLAFVAPTARRYTETMYGLAFVLHRGSPATYDILRQIVALQHPSALALHFREFLHEGRTEIRGFFFFPCQLTFNSSERPFFFFPRKDVVKNW